MNIVAVSLFSGAGGLGVASFLAGVPVMLDNRGANMKKAFFSQIFFYT